MHVPLLAVSSCSPPRLPSLDAHPDPWPRARLALQIIIDVPLAWKLLWEGFGWPLRAFAELKNGKLLEADSNITVSPR